MSDLAGYAVAKPRWELLEVLASIARYQDTMFHAGRSAKNVRWGRVGAWTIVRQEEIIAWYARLMKRFGRPDELASICRRTLNYQLAGLERGKYISREQRHTNRRGTRKLDLRPSLIKFSTLGRLWISRHVRGVANPLEQLAVQKTAQSGFNGEGESSTSLSRAVDRTPTAPGASRRGKTAAARARVSSSISRAPRPPSKAQVRKEPRRPARIAPAARSARGRGRTAKRRRRRS